LLLQIVDLLSEVGNLRSLRLDDSKLTLVVTNLELKQSDVLQSFSILDFTSGQSTLQDLDLFVKESQLVISSNELSTQDISFINDVLVILFELINLIRTLSNDVVELGNLTSELLLLLFRNRQFSFNQLSFVLKLVNVLLSVSFLVNLTTQGLIFGGDLVLKLGDLMRGDTELSSHICDLILSFNEIFRVEISVGSDSFIQVLLLFKLSLEFNVLFLELTDEVLLQLDFFNHLHQVSVGS